MPHNAELGGGKRLRASQRRIVRGRSHNCEGERDCRLGLFTTKIQRLKLLALSLTFYALKMIEKITIGNRLERFGR